MQNHRLGIQSDIVWASSTSQYINKTAWKTEMEEILFIYSIGQKLEASSTTKNTTKYPSTYLADLPNSPKY